MSLACSRTNAALFATDYPLLTRLSSHRTKRSDTCHHRQRVSSRGRCCVVVVPLLHLDDSSQDKRGKLGKLDWLDCIAKTQELGKACACVKLFDCMHTYTYMHVLCICIQIHTYMYIRMQNGYVLHDSNDTYLLHLVLYVHTYSYICMQMYVRMLYVCIRIHIVYVLCICIQIHTCLYKRTHTYSYICIHVHIYMHTEAYFHANMYTCMFTACLPFM